MSIGTRRGRKGCCFAAGVIFRGDHLPERDTNEAGGKRIGDEYAKIDKDIKNIKDTAKCVSKI